MKSVCIVKVDVIIAVYNAESTIEECVKSVLNQVISENLITKICCGDNNDDDSRKRNHPPSFDDIHFDISICCYNDASTDKSLDILHSLENINKVYHASMKTKLLVGTAPIGTTSRGAGYARNQAVKLRDEYESNNTDANNQNACTNHFLCILDSDDTMKPTRIVEQTFAMLSLSEEVRERTLMGCQFERIPKDATHHYSQWANSISDERLYLEQFRECTLIQPTWFLSKAWFEHLGGYLEAPVSSANIDDAKDDKRYYRLIHPSEMASDTDTTTNTNGSKNEVSTLRVAEDTRLWFAHLQMSGKLHLHRTQSPLVSYRHRPGMSQSSNTPRKLLLRLRAKAWEDIIYTNSAIWSTNGFAIWGAGRDGKDFLKALSSDVVSKCVCFVDVDRKKIEQVKWYDNSGLLGSRKIPILHYSVLAKNASGSIESFGHIDKKARGEDTFNVAATKRLESNGRNKSAIKKRKTAQQDCNKIDPEILQQLPVVVCVAMYRTNGALESNVGSIGRVEGQDLWHII